jgi:hypothetical protein
MEAVDAACADVGRDPSTLERSACVYLDLAGRTGRYRREHDVPPVRSLEECADAVSAYEAMGLSHIMLWLDPCTVETVDALGEALEGRTKAGLHSVRTSDSR